MSKRANLIYYTFMQHLIFPQGTILYVLKGKKNEYKGTSIQVLMLSYNLDVFCLIQVKATHFDNFVN